MIFLDQSESVEHHQRFYQITPHGARLTRAGGSTQEIGMVKRILVPEDKD